LVGWELSRGEANLDDAEIARCLALGTERARFAVESNAVALEVNRSLFGGPGISLPDPVAMAVALDPGVVTRKSRHAVDVECDGVLTRGMTVVDQLDVVRRGLAEGAGWPPRVASREPNVTVCWEIDTPLQGALSGPRLSAVTPSSSTPVPAPPDPAEATRRRHEHNAFPRPRSSGSTRPPRLAPLQASGRSPRTMKMSFGSWWV
jgi:hypothetical protein